MMQLDVGGKQSMVRPTVATKECYYYAMAQTEQTVSYKICLVTARGSNDGEDVAGAGACWEVRHITLLSSHAEHQR